MNFLVQFSCFLCESGERLLKAETGDINWGESVTCCCLSLILGRIWRYNFGGVKAVKHQGITEKLLFLRHHINNICAVARLSSEFSKGLHYFKYLLFTPLMRGAHPYLWGLPNTQYPALDRWVNRSLLFTYTHNLGWAAMQVMQVHKGWPKEQRQYIQRLWEAGCLVSRGCSVLSSHGRRSLAYLNAFSG